MSIPPEIVLIRPGGAKRRHGARSPFVGSPGATEKGKFASARPAAVRAPTGGWGQLPAVWISPGPGTHAHLAGYGRRWLLGTRREEIAISTLMRAEIARRYRRCLQATHGRSQLRERAVQIPEISTEPGIVLIRPWGAKRRQGARSQISLFPAPDHTKGQRAPWRRLAPHGRMRTIPGANDIYRDRTARSRSWLRP